MTTDVVHQSRLVLDEKRKTMRQLRWQGNVLLKCVDFKQRTIWFYQACE